MIGRTPGEYSLFDLCGMVLSPIMKLHSRCSDIFCGKAAGRNIFRKPRCVCAKYCNRGGKASSIGCNI